MDEHVPISLDEATDFIERGELDRAISALQRVLRLTPDSAAAHLKLAQVYRKKVSAGERVLGKLVDRECGEAVRLTPPSQRAHETLVETGVKYGLGKELIAQYQTTQSGLPFAHDCVQMIRSLSPESTPLFDGTLLQVLKEKFHLVLIAAALVAFGWWYSHRGPSGGSVGAQGDFTLPNLAGQSISLSDFRGKKVVILDFWATWCGPCRASLPALARLREEYGPKGLEVLSIDLREDPDTITNYLESESLSLHVLLDKDGSVANAYGVRGIPSMFVIDKQGNMSQKFVGYSAGMEEKLEELIKSLL